MIFDKFLRIAFFTERLRWLLLCLIMFMLILFSETQIFSDLKLTGMILLFFKDYGNSKQSKKCQEWLLFKQKKYTSNPTPLLKSMEIGYKKQGKHSFAVSRNF